MRRAPRAPPRCPGTSASGSQGALVAAQDRYLGAVSCPVPGGLLGQRMRGDEDQEPPGQPARRQHRRRFPRCMRARCGSCPSRRWHGAAPRRLGAALRARPLPSPAPGLELRREIGAGFLCRVRRSLVIGLGHCRIVPWRQPIVSGQPQLGADLRQRIGEAVVPAVCPPGDPAPRFPRTRPRHAPRWPRQAARPRRRAHRARHGRPCC